VKAKGTNIENTIKTVEVAKRVGLELYGNII
jgi:hypothetical protein